jgi:ubiquinone/menaquinone biosynthesis C-methylase UbiE
MILLRKVLDLKMKDRLCNVFNILHAEKPEELLKESYRILKPDGKLSVIHWNYDPETPRGPPITIRPRTE